MTVVLETQRQLIEAEIQLHQFKATAEASVIELEYAVGGRLESSADETHGNDGANNCTGENS